MMADVGGATTGAPDAPAIAEAVAHTNSAGNATELVSLYGGC
jgi:hypothetical protein